MTQPAVRPFYETIVETIALSGITHLSLIGSLITKTLILENHDAIIAAWKNRVLCQGFNIPGVLEHLENQKQLAEASKPRPCYIRHVDPVTGWESWTPVEQPTTDPQTEGK